MVVRPAFRAHIPRVTPLHWWCLGLISLLVLGAGLGLRHPWSPDEPRYVLIAREMLSTGQWLIPHRAGELYPDKPPLYFWLVALAQLVTGSPKAFLLPSLLAGLGTQALVADLARRLYGARIGLLAGMALLITTQFTLQAKSAQIDMTVTFFITLGVYGLLRHALLGPARRWWYTGFIAMGLGIMTKGVGFLPLLMLPAWALLHWRRPAGPWRPHPLKAKELAGGLGLLVLTLSLWVVPMVIYTTWLHPDPALAAYRDNILFKQTGQRYADSWAHVQPAWYFIVDVLPWAWLPWTLTLPWVAPSLWRRIRRADARVWLPMSMLGLMLLFFSMSPGKRGVYMTPTAPLLILILAPLLPGLLRAAWPNRLCWWLAMTGGAVLGLVGLLGAAGLPSLTRLAAEEGLSPWAWWGVTGALTLGLALFIRPRQGLMLYTPWILLCWLGWSLVGYPQMDTTRSAASLMREVVAVTGARSTLALSTNNESAMLEARQPVVTAGIHAGSDEEFERFSGWIRQAPTSRFMLVDYHELDDHPCVDPTRSHRLTHGGDDWALIPATALETCPASSYGVSVIPAPPLAMTPP
ncbi:ArnT family glycosyltransferase [Larsenimonas rhizosphaerae]|uniref:ArnT family glycosyltransferase n=1 Tax=Larsenimonas rhizosphaerae TaxID=2944682 RepID=UPI002034775C|nr:glycosyltransferase family 39 protein [Larsenimonas rhizosphaerae]MCM2129626.1 glycosyltransferase family 39 protein [Larsenimonas rhizosphaerae]